MKLFRLVSISVCLGLMSLAVFAAPQRIYRFDMGTATSPTAGGYTKITEASSYQKQPGYGWEGGTYTSFDTSKPEQDPQLGRPPDQLVSETLIYLTYVDDVNRDGVASSGDMIFRVDLPNGLYRVRLLLGNMRKATFSMEVWANGKQLAGELRAGHLKRRGTAQDLWGFFKEVRFAVPVEDNALRIRIHGNDAAFRAREEKELARTGPVESFLVPGHERDMDPQKGWRTRDIGGPFTENSMLALEVFPHTPLPVEPAEPHGKTLRVGAGHEAANLGPFVEAFNGGNSAEAEKALEAVSEPYAKALGCLWLAGRPEYEEEVRLLQQALDLLKTSQAAHGDEPGYQEIARVTDWFRKGIKYYVDRADTSDGAGSYNHCEMAAEILRQIQVGDPLYYKAQIYAARALYMVDPHRWTPASGTARDIMQGLRDAGLGDNRYVRLYLDNQWSPAADWKWPDYLAEAQGAPEWAAELYSSYNHLLDLCEWWRENRQAPDGSLGGGWGDDVEALRIFGSYASICLDATPKTVEMCRMVSDGAWNSGAIDTERGYFASVGDTEHTGEWTGDTLPVMVLLDYGNPVYLERAMLTGKLMRDLWMDHDSNGHLRMRSNFLGATGVGTGFTANDSLINYRPALPARMVLWYSGNPTLAKIFNEWADAWLTSAMSTAKGKQRGVIPEEVASGDGELGGKGAPSWYKANRVQGTVNYDWEGLRGYREYAQDLLVGAYQRTGDRRYIEPFKLEAELATTYRQNPIENPQEGSEAWAGKMLTAGTREDGATEIWERIGRLLEPSTGTPRPGISLEEVTKQAKQTNRGARERFPLATTESMATDRIGFPGLGNPYMIYSGTALGGVTYRTSHVTYIGVGRRFAAAPIYSDERNLKVLMYSFHDKPIEAGIRPWVLDVGGKYRVRFYALPGDIAGDAVIREEFRTSEHEWSLPVRGTIINFQLPPRQTFVIEVNQIEAGRGAALRPDAAIAPGDILFRPEAKDVVVAVHNVGAADARHVRVALYDGDPSAGGQKIGESAIPNLPAPLDLVSKIARVSFKWEPKKAEHAIFAVVDPDGELTEITRTNNVAFAILPRAEKAAEPSPRTPAGQA